MNMGTTQLDKGIDSCMLDDSLANHSLEAIGVKIGEMYKGIGSDGRELTFTIAGVRDDSSDLGEELNENSRHLLESLYVVKIGETAPVMLGYLDDMTQFRAGFELEDTIGKFKFEKLGQVYVGNIQESIRRIF